MTQAFSSQNLSLFIISSAAFIAGLDANIYNRMLNFVVCNLPQANSALTAGINDIERELHATSGDISLSLALFILMQGVLPLFWSVASELKGRKVRTIRFLYPADYSPVR